MARPPATAADPAPSATEIVDALIASAREAGASDVHVEPTREGVVVRRRVDGVLIPAGRHPASAAAAIVARLKVLADLLTYRTEIPQEGRLRGDAGSAEVRLSTFPTAWGEKAVLRFFSEAGRHRRVDELGLGDDVGPRLRRLLGETSGAIVLSGPAGGGKTTTLYACLRELVDASGGTRSLASLEDPIEVVVDGVAQSQVNLHAGLDLPTGLRSLLRQDPEVIAVGEIRDRVAAEVAFQAALSGHLVLTTYHAGGAAGAVGRLADMGVEPYVLRSGLLAVVSQRLVRRLCDCAAPGVDASGRLGLDAASWRVPVGCDRCRSTGYLGRLALSEILIPADGPVASAILARLDVASLESAAISSGMIPLGRRAVDAVDRGLTSPGEIRRVFGLGTP